MAINHIGYLDFTFAGYAALPAGRLVRLAKQEVFSHPISGPLMRGMHHIPVDRAAGAASYRAALQALRAGEIVGVFRKRPSAGRSSSRSSSPARIGWRRPPAPLLPTVVWGSRGLDQGPAAPAGSAARPHLGLRRGAGGGAARHRADVAGSIALMETLRNCAQEER